MANLLQILIILTEIVYNMTLIKHTKAFTGNDSFLKINLNQNISCLGDQDDIDSLVTKQAQLKINDVTDLEKTVFKSSSDFTFSFNFYNGTSFDNSYINAGFSLDSIIQKKLSFKNSFYIIDVYDSFNSNIQKKLTTQYFTNLNREISTYYFNPNNINTYVNKQLSQLFIPLNYINSTNVDTIDMYFKISFYNAHIGKLHVFYDVTSSNNDQSKYYTKILVNKINKTFSFHKINPTLINFNEITDEEYINKINKSFGSNQILKQLLPSTNIFDYKTTSFI